MRGALSTRSLLYLRPLTPAANIQEYGPTKFAYLLVATNWTSFSRSWERLQPFSLLWNSAYCFALARSGHRKPQSLYSSLLTEDRNSFSFSVYSSLPKEARESFPFSLYSSPVTEDWKIFPFSVYSFLLV